MHSLRVIDNHSGVSRRNLDTGCIIHAVNLSPSLIQIGGIMTLEGTVVNGTIQLDPPAQLPEGTRVVIQPKEETDAEKPTLTSLLNLAGTAKTLPPDFAAQHDHYIHGTPKR